MHAVSPERRRVMQAVKDRDTKPEMTVRRITHAMGYRYRLHGKNLLGKPDLVFPSRKKVILVHGCFWHGHDCSRGARVPKTNRKYWKAKITGNRERDKKIKQELSGTGWGVLTIWECKMKDLTSLQNKIRKFLD